MIGQMKRYGVDNSHLGAFKATRQITQIPQSPGYSRALEGASEGNGLETRADIRHLMLLVILIVNAKGKKNNSYNRRFFLLR